MSWWTDLGKNVGEGSVQEAHSALNDFLTRLDPLLNNLFTRVQFLLHSLMDRVSVNIQISIKPAKATAANPPTNEDVQPTG